MNRGFAMLFGACLLIGPASADVVKLKDGRSFEGTIVEQDDQKVIIKTKFGLNELKRAEVESVEIKATPEQEFRDRRKTSKGDAKALFELYEWAKINGLKSQSKQALRDVIKADPEHGDARRLLGYVQFKDRWVSKREAEKLEAAEERKAKLAQGLVEYKGEWMSPEDKEVAEMTDKGFEKIEGEWVNVREKKRKQAEAKLRAEIAEHKAKGEFPVNGKWLPKAEAEAYYADLNNPYKTEGQKVRVYTNNGIDFGEKMLVAADATYRKCQSFFGKEPELEDAFMHVYVVANTEDFNRLGNGWNADEQSSNFYTFFTPWLPENEHGVDMATVTQYSQADSLTEIYVVHATAEQYLQRMMGQNAVDPAPRWFVNGVAAYVSRFQNPKYFGWSRDRLLSLGGMLKLKTFFGGYQPHENYILGGGLLVSFLKSPDCPEELQKLFNETVIAFNEGKKVQKAFRKLEKEMIKQEDAFREFAGL